MKKTILIIVLALAAIGLGVGAASGAAYLMHNRAAQFSANTAPGFSPRWGQGNPPVANYDNYGNGYGRGQMMNGNGYGRGQMMNGNGYGRGQIMNGNGYGRGQMMNGNGYGRGQMMNGNGYGRGQIMNGNGYGRGQIMNGNGYGRGQMMNGNGYGRGQIMNGNGYGRQMMNGYGGWNQSQPTGERISIDTALEKANLYLASSASTLKVKEVMQFERNFYVMTTEAETGKGAMELLVDPWSGNVFPEPGPNHMWNQKYGHMAAWGSTTAAANTVTLDNAKTEAQKFLDANVAGTKVEGSGAEFYGYYTFDYEKDGKIAGMLSINGQTGQAWLHTWHGSFISEKVVE